MKLFAFAIAFLVLALSVMPCADTGAIGKSTATTIIKATHQQDQDHDDDCTPFCQCSCCAGFSINHSIAGFPTIVLPEPLHTFFSFPLEVIEVALPIWQPPRIV